MAKRKDTLLIEEALRKKTREDRIYGCEEVTIGFYNSGHGNEIVDFMTMDSKGIIKCYEIKVTIEDFKSKAAKSFYGDYNYFVMPAVLAEKVLKEELVPDGIGILAFKGDSEYFWFEVIKKPRRKKDVPSEMLKESLIRSMYYKYLKYYDACDIEKTKMLKKEINKYKKIADDNSSEVIRLKNEIFLVSSLFQETEEGRVSKRNAWDSLLKKANANIRKIFE